MLIVLVSYSLRIFSALFKWLVKLPGTLPLPKYRNKIKLLNSLDLIFFQLTYFGMKPYHISKIQILLAYYHQYIPVILYMYSGENQSINVKSKSGCILF